MHEVQKDLSACEEAMATLKLNSSVLLVEETKL